MSYLDLIQKVKKIDFLKNSSFFPGPTAESTISAFAPTNASQIIANQTTETEDFFKDSSAVIYPQNLFSPGNEAYVFFIMRDAVLNSQSVYKRLALYMPPSIKIRYGANWEEIDMKLYAYGSAANELYDGNGDTAARLLSNLGAKLVDTVSGAGNMTQQLLELEKRRTSDPKQALLFKTVDFRQFQFDFELLARSVEESNAIRQIIKIFKWGMHPGRGGNTESTFLEYPNIFDVYLLTPSSKYMFNIKQSVLTDINVDYGGSGSASFFKNTGAPVDIRLSLQFKELSILTKEDIVKDY